jgi:glycosyltransferase involved in cell wall biosynthesis
MTWEVSVIIPVYNALEFLKDSIQSALDQKEVKEVLAIDDGSTDGSYEYLEKWAFKEPRLTLLTHQNRENKGPGASRNLGIEMSSSAYISFLDADDYFLENRYANTMAEFDNNSDLEAVYEPSIFISSIPEYEDYYQGYIPQIDGTYYLCFNNAQSDLLPIEKWWLDGGHYGICGLTLKKSIFDKIGGFDISLLQAEDTDLHYRIALYANASFINDPIQAKSVRRIHGRNISLKASSKNDSLKLLIDKYLFLIDRDYNHKLKQKVIIKYLLTRGSFEDMNRVMRYLRYFYYCIDLFARKPKILLYLIK